MADKSLFSRLKKLFSANLIIRKVDGKTRVIDINKLQAYGARGQLATNYAVDRFTRMVSAGGTYGSVEGQRSTYQMARRQLFSDYEMMSTDAIISAALDIFSDESGVKDEFGRVLTIRSNNSKIQESR